MSTNNQPSRVESPDALPAHQPPIDAPAVSAQQDMAHHAPGPFLFDPEDSSGHITDADGCIVATVGDSSLHGRILKNAHGRLLAASPELREACEQAHYWLQEELENPGQATPDEILRVLASALSKAGFPVP